MSPAPSHGERCQQDVEPVLGVDPLGDALFALWGCPNCGEEMSQTSVREGPEPPG